MVKYIRRMILMNNSYDLYIYNPIYFPENNIKITGKCSITL